MLGFSAQPTSTSRLQKFWIEDNGKDHAFPYFDHSNTSVAANNHLSQIMRAQADCRHLSSVLWRTCRDRGSQPPNSQGDFRPRAYTRTRFRRAHKPKASCAKGASQWPNAKKWCMTLRLCTLHVCALRPYGLCLRSWSLGGLQPIGHTIDS